MRFDSATVLGWRLICLSELTSNLLEGLDRIPSRSCGVLAALILEIPLQLVFTFPILSSNKKIGNLKRYMPKNTFGLSLCPRRVKYSVNVNESFLDNFLTVAGPPL